MPAQTAAEAMATLGGAMAAAQSMSVPYGDALIDASRAAFVNALQLNAWIGAAVVVVASVLSACILRSAAPDQAAAQ